MSYTCVGDVRGECGVEHRRLSVCEAHCALDNREVKRGNGPGSYSDRRPRERRNGELVSPYWGSEG